MSFLTKLLGVKNSVFICLSWKEIRNDEAKCLEILDEVARYYPFQQFNLDKRGKIPLGCGFLAIDSARRDVVQSFLPKLSEKKIPHILFLDPNRIGTNRLSLEDEARLLSVDDPESFLRTAWENPTEAEAELTQLRTRLGRFPVEKTEPTELFETWGKLRLLDPTLTNFGYALDCIPSSKNLPSIQESIRFAAVQLQTSLKLVLASRPVSGDTLGLPVLTTTKGSIDSQTPLCSIPIWDVQRDSE